MMILIIQYNCKHRSENTMMALKIILDIEMEIIVLQKLCIDS